MPDPALVSAPGPPIAPAWLSVPACVSKVPPAGPERRRARGGEARDRTERAAVQPEAARRRPEVGVGGDLDGARVDLGAAGVGVGRAEGEGARADLRQPADAARHAGRGQRRAGGRLEGAAAGFEHAVRVVAKLAVVREHAAIEAEAARRRTERAVRRDREGPLVDLGAAGVGIAARGRRREDGDAGAGLLDDARADDLADIDAVVGLREAQPPVVADVVEVARRIGPGRKALGPRLEGAERVDEDAGPIAGVVAGQGERALGRRSSTGSR